MSTATHNGHGHGHGHPHPHKRHAHKSSQDTKKESLAQFTESIQDEKDIDLQTLSLGDDARSIKVRGQQVDFEAYTRNC